MFKKLQQFLKMGFSNLSFMVTSSHLPYCLVAGTNNCIMKNKSSVLSFFKDFLFPFVPPQQHFVFAVTWCFHTMLHVLLNLFITDLLPHNTTPTNILGSETQELNNSAVLSKAVLKKSPDLASAGEKKTTCWNITYNRRFRFIGTQLITCLSGFRNNKTLCKILYTSTR